MYPQINFSSLQTNTIINFVLQLGLDGGEIGVITPLRQQQNLIREKLQQDKHSSSFSHSFCRECEGRGLDKAVTAEAGGSGSHGDATSTGVSCCSGVEVNTVDKYQGRDKECILVSCTRSNSKGNVSTVWTYNTLLLHVVGKKNCFHPKNFCSNSPTIFLGKAMHLADPACTQITPHL